MFQYRCTFNLKTHVTTRISSFVGRDNLRWLQIKIMESNGFDWYEETMDIDVGEFSPKEDRKTLFQKIYEFSRSFSNYAALLSLFVLGIRYLLGYRRAEISGINLNVILASFTTFFGSFTMVSGVVNILATILKQFSNIFIDRHIDNLNSLVAVVIWLSTNLYLLELVKDEFPMFSYAKKVVISSLMTSAIFAVGVFIMENFYIYFLKRSLYVKIKEVDIREKILSSMKNYRYEIFEVSSSESYSRGCLDLLWGGNEGGSSENHESRIDLRRDSQRLDARDLFLQTPELYNVFDAKTLARDVFMKASSDGRKLTFKDFSSIFPNEQVALQAFAFFDTNDEKQISKKDFRDTVIMFFVERMSLEKSIEIAEKFVNIIRNIFYAVIFGFLFLAYLVIFGIPLKDLLAFALSSALVLNFVISGMATEMYFNIIFIMSHPFDVGDDVVIDGVDLKVFQIGLSSTSFLGSNGGKIKFLNSDLWRKSVVNMTRAPEKKLVFQFSLDSRLPMDVYKNLREKILGFLREHHFDFFEKFALESTSENFVAVSSLNCRLVLLCRGYKTRTKKFYLRAEFSKFLNEVFDDMGVKAT